MSGRGGWAWVVLSLLLTGPASAGDATDLTENPLGLPEAAVSQGGSLVIGGGGDLPDEVYDEFVRLAGGSRARIVLIPSAYPYGDPDIVRSRFSGWRNYDLQSFDFLDTDSRDEAEDPDFCDVLAEATGVWIPGGYQGRVMGLYGGTPVETAIRRVLERGGVVGGTSAGAAVISQVMIRYGSTTQAEVDSGLGLLRRAVVDQHFSQRGRHGRLLNVLEDHPRLIGVGVDECTALVVQRNQLRVLGESNVTLYVPSKTAGALWTYRLKPGSESKLAAVPPSDEPDEQLVSVQRME